MEGDGRNRTNGHARLSNTERIISMPPRSTIPIDVRFWALVKKTTDNSCWEWQGRRNEQRGGYGTFSPARGRDYRAHRFAWELTHGAIPDGTDVCHSCDNPPCCRPDHLFLGDAAANVADMVSKGRSTTGSTHGLSKLTEAQVIEIRRRYDAAPKTPRGRVLGPDSQPKLAKEFNVSTMTIGLITQRKTWLHV